MVAFHGVKDPIFPFTGKTKQRVFFSPFIGHAMYNFEDFCLPDTIALNGLASSADLVNASTYNMYKILKSLGKLTEEYADCQMFHGLDDDCDTCNFQSDFGTGATTQEEVWLYMAQRAAIFFQGVLTGADSSDFEDTLFVDCENYRTDNCNYSDYNDGCSNTDSCPGQDPFD